MKNCFASNIFDLSYDECYVSFRLDIAPTYLFGGVYINPENSKYFTPEMFAELDSLLVRCDENDYIPYIGGDFNSRLDDFNLLCSSCHYESNVDKTTNSHGRIFMADICKRNNVYPFNHLKYKGVSYDGDFTYYKNEKMSQIDLVLTNDKGKNVKSFKIVDCNWHISEHRPVNVNICVNNTLSTNALLVMAQNWNHEFSPYKPPIQRFNKSYDLQIIYNYILRENETIFDNIASALNEGNVEKAVSKFDIFVKDMHKCAKTLKPKVTHPNNAIIMNEADEKFRNYCEYLLNRDNEAIRHSLAEYQAYRKDVSHEMLREESEKWRSFTNNKGSKEMWSRIDWKGNVSKSNLNIHPTINELKFHFETIYTAEDQLEIEKINQLSTDVYIPMLDDPIDNKEIHDALNDCKKRWF